MLTTLVLCAETDLDALWAWQGLRARLNGPVELVTTGLLTHALRWRHELGEGTPTVEIALADGRVLRSGEIGGVINRLTYVPLDAAAASPADRAYAEQEWNAFLLSWLHALPGPMLNRPAPLGLAGALRPAAIWMDLAAKAGLPVQATRFPEVAPRPPAGCRALVVGKRVLSAPLGEDLSAGCVRLAALAGCGLLGVDFSQDALGRWRFSDALPTPPLRRGGATLLTALTEALQP